jgi:hypothetical protein
LRVASNKKLKERNAMGVYERVFGKKDLSALIEDFTNRPDFDKAIQRIKETKSISQDHFEIARGFEVISEMAFEEGNATNHELTLYLKYNTGVLIKLTELKVKNEQEEKENKLFTIDVELIEKVNDKTSLSKFAIDDGEFTFTTTVEDYNNEDVVVPYYLEIPTQSEDATIMASPVPCFNWDGSGTCCRFRYNGLPWNPVVTYNWCGAGCGGGCGNSPSRVNALDSCCQTHDCCYVTYSSYPNRCTCDRLLINCARAADYAGASRVVTAFQAKRLYFGC